MARQRLLALAILIGGGAAPSADAAAAAAPLVEVGRHAMHEPRLAAAAVVAGDSIYIIGGMNATTPTLDSVERFNLRTGESQPFARLRTGRVDHGAALVGSHIYVIGGRAAFGSAPKHEASVEIIDLETGEVTAGLDMPVAKAAFACLAVDGRIHVIGGHRWTSGQRAWTNTMQVLDVGTGSWSEGPPMPTPRESQAVVVDGGFIVVAGGFNGKRALQEVEAFNPHTGTWRSLPALPERVSGHSAAFLGHHIFLFGESRTPQQLLAYHLVTKSSEILRLKDGAMLAAAVVHNQRIYVIGGKASRNWEAWDRIHVYALSGNEQAPSTGSPSK